MLFDSKANDIRALLIDRQETVAVAESVTSGYVQAMLSTAENAMQFYEGGITTYNLLQKSRHLKIDEIEGTRTNCVSANIAMQMSLGVQELFLTSYGLAITGYAAPAPEEGVHELFAYYAIAYKGTVTASGMLRSDRSSMPEAQMCYARKLLERFEEVLKR